MDIQITLNWVIQVLVMGLVSFIVIDFVNTVFDACTAAYTATKIQQLHSSSSSQIALTLPTPAPIENACAVTQFDQLPDPWLSTEIQPIPIQPPVVRSFPTLRLLPPAPQVQPKARATTKSSTAKRTTKPTNKTATQKSSKSRKKAAA